MLPRYIPFPFFLSIAAAEAQKRGHEVLLLDGVAGNLAQTDFLRKIESFRPGLVFCETSTPSLSHDKSLWRKIREQNPSALICGGGTHYRESAENLVQEGSLDFWIKGEYEFAAADLADALDKGLSINKVDGVISRSYESPRNAHISCLDSLPAPLFAGLPMLDYADPVCGLPAPTAQSWLSRGCPFACTFCVWPQIVYGDRQHRKRSIRVALDEVEFLIREYGCESFYFDDDTANIGESRMKELAEGVTARGLSKYPWSMMARADIMTPEMIDNLAAAGIYSIKYGVESVSPRLINSCKKATNLEALRRTLALTKSAGIKMHLTFTFGIPGETVETIKETIDFALETAPETAQFSVCTPFPGTEFHDECVKNGWLVTDDWQQYLGNGKAVVQTPWLKAEELEKSYDIAVDKWKKFCERRLAERKRRLLEQVEALVGAGSKWTLLGDKEFAGFIKACNGGKLTGSFVEKPGPETIDVIVSRYDEEKIRRALKRANPERADRALRLYG